MISSLGIDTSLTGTGIVVLENGKIVLQKLIKSKPTSDGKPVDEVNRIVKIVSQIEEVVSELNPTIAVIEGPAFAVRNTSSLVQLGALSYMTRAMLIDYHIPFIICFPTTLKKYVTGNGASKKDVMIHETYKRWGVSILNDNEADAYGLSQIGLSLKGGNSKDVTKIQQEVLDLLSKQL